MPECEFPKTINKNFTKLCTKEINNYQKNTVKRTQPTFYYKE